MGLEGSGIAVGELRHLIQAIGVSMLQGGNFLLHRLAPNGPIMREPNLSYVHKASWGLYAAGADREVVWRLIDWAKEKGLRPNKDFYIDGEGPEYKITQRAYRPLTFGKVAAWIGHPLFEDREVLNRMLQYQHSSGGVFNYIGEDPGKVEEQATIGSLNTTFFGHLMLALDMRSEALKAGDWVRNLVEKNSKSMREDGKMYTQMTPDGRLVKEVRAGERISKVVDNKSPKQEFWHVGTAMAYLCALYEAMRERWGYSGSAAEPYLRSALELIEFEDTMPLETYLWPSKCKVGWGAGELLKVLVKYGVGEEKHVGMALRACTKVATFTFMDNQLPSGGWPCMHYPLSESSPAMEFDYKPLKGMVNVPESPIEGSGTIFLPAEEITGEFLGEMKSIEVGLKALLKHLTSG
ncbi:MAG: hypothetical protein JTT11_09695 [Candidatus Brockarchaeota archaeon]|nr:hypothetical protein [Candidatus Brockarchaeota archaeon]